MIGYIAIALVHLVKNDLWQMDNIDEVGSANSLNLINVSDCETTLKTVGLKQDPVGWLTPAKILDHYVCYVPIIKACVLCDSGLMLIVTFFYQPL